MFPDHPKEVPPFLEQIRTVIVSIIKVGSILIRTHYTCPCHLPWKLDLTELCMLLIIYSCVQCWKTFDHLWQWCSRNIWTSMHIKAKWHKTYRCKLKVCGVGGKIFELDYGVLKIIVLLCNWVKTNYNGSSATIKRDEYDFTVVNFSSLFPISDASFVCLLHVE
jgi:hypothetical protein